MIDLLKGEISEAEKILWMALSFLASEPEQQKAKIGPAGDWFCKEDKNKNPGANYLRGIGIIYIDYWGFGLAEVDGNHEHEIVFIKIKNLFEKMFWEKECWSQNTLAENRDWHDLRILANQALHALGLDLHPLRKPISFPDIIQMEHYDYKRDPWK